MVRIRLTRRGKKGAPFYRIVVTDKRTSMSGMPIEEIGTYDPKTKALRIDKVKAQEWIKKGAVPTSIVSTLLKR